jgi:AraC-like DNA-binding protein
LRWKCPLQKKKCPTEKDWRKMHGYSPKELIEIICSDIGMSPKGNEPHGCGTRLEGDGKTTSGYFWYLAHENRFVISQCDFVFCRDVQMGSPANALYIALRLDYARHLPPGMILAFMEEKGGHANAFMKNGTRVAYTEVMYLAPFYKSRLETYSAGLHVDPVKILKNMGGEHNWPPEMMEVLTDIMKVKQTGIAAELYFIAKSYELMAMLVAMGDSRLPKKTSDYDHVLGVIRHIDQNYTKNIKQNDLVRLASMSPTKLKNLFRQFTGCTITEYMMNKKADDAAHLLADSDMTVEEIARIVGFDTATGFTTSFKKQIGIPPSEYRKRIMFHCVKNPSEIENLSFENDSIAD